MVTAEDKPHHEFSGHHMGGPHHFAKHPFGMHGALHGDGMSGYHGATSAYGKGDEGGAADMTHGMHDAKHHELHGHHAAAHHAMKKHAMKHGAMGAHKSPPTNEA